MRSSLELERIYASCRRCVVNGALAHLLQKRTRTFSATDDRCLPVDFRPFRAERSTTTPKGSAALVDCERPVAGGKLGIEHQAVLIPQVEQQVTPALGTLAKAVLDRQQLLAPAGVGADQHQQAAA